MPQAQHLLRTGTIGFACTGAVRSTPAGELLLRRRRQLGVPAGVFHLGHGAAGRYRQRDATLIKRTALSRLQDGGPSADCHFGLYQEAFARDRDIVGLIDQQSKTSGHLQLPSAACGISVRAPGPGFGSSLSPSQGRMRPPAKRFNTVFALD
jgi:hypothetical protein